MILSKNLIKLLHLNDIEQEILVSLERADLNVSQIAKATKIPRTTLYTAIDSLQDRNLIRMRKQGKSTILSPISTNHLAEILENESIQMVEHGTFTLKNRKAAQNLQNPSQSAITFIYGKDAMLNVWIELAHTSNHRLQCIQPTSSLETVLKKYEPSVFIPLNNAIKKNKVVMETIVNENSFSTYMDTYKTKPHIQKQIIQSFIGRATDTTMVKNNLLKNNADLILTSREAFLMNWEHEVGIRIKNRDIVDLLHELFKLAKGYGKKMDFNEYLRGFLEKI